MIDSHHRRSSHSNSIASSNGSVEIENNHMNDNNTTNHNTNNSDDDYEFIDEPDDHGFLSPHQDELLDTSTKALVSKVREGIENGISLGQSKEEEGTSGVYFFKDIDSKIVAVFKPHDEEQGMPNNPRNRTGDGAFGLGLRDNFKPGYGCIREWATFQCDVNGFVGVPPTLLVNCLHPEFSNRNNNNSSSSNNKTYPKFGSLQAFVSDTESVENIGWSMYSDLAVQKAALLDMRVLNCDRNSENLLVSGWQKGLSRDMMKETLKLVPIDHGYAFPQELEIYGVDWSWMSAFQVRAPVHPEIKNYLKNLDFESIAGKLKRHLPEECLYLLRVAHHLVVEGVKAGLTLYEIANCIVRDDLDPDRPSRLEEILYNSTENAFRAIEIRTSRTVPGYASWRRNAVAKRDPSAEISAAPEVALERQQRGYRLQSPPNTGNGLSGHHHHHGLTINANAANNGNDALQASVGTSAVAVLSPINDNNNHNNNSSSSINSSNSKKKLDPTMSFVRGGRFLNNRHMSTQLSATITLDHLNYTHTDDHNTCNNNSNSVTPMKNGVDLQVDLDADRYIYVETDPGIGHDTVHDNSNSNNNGNLNNNNHSSKQGVVVDDQSSIMSWMSSRSGIGGVGSLGGGDLRRMSALQHISTSPTTNTASPASVRSDNSDTHNHSPFNHEKQESMSTITTNTTNTIDTTNTTNTIDTTNCKDADSNSYSHSYSNGYSNGYRNNDFKVDMNAKEINESNEQVHCNVEDELGGALGRRISPRAHAELLMLQPSEAVSAPTSPMVGWGNNNNGNRSRSGSIGNDAALLTAIASSTAKANTVNSTSPKSPLMGNRTLHIHTNASANMINIPNRKLVRTSSNDAHTSEKVSSPYFSHTNSPSSNMNSNSSSPIANVCDNGQLVLNLDEMNSKRFDQMNKWNMKHSIINAILDPHRSPMSRNKKTVGNLSPVTATTNNNNSNSNKNKNKESSLDSDALLSVDMKRTSSGSERFVVLPVPMHRQNSLPAGGPVNAYSRKRRTERCNSPSAAAGLRVTIRSVDANSIYRSNSTMSSTNGIFTFDNSGARTPPMRDRGVETSRSPRILTRIHSCDSYFADLDRENVAINMSQQLVDLMTTMDAIELVDSTPTSTSSTIPSLLQKTIATALTPLSPHNELDETESTKTSDTPVGYSSNSSDGGDSIRRSRIDSENMISDKFNSTTTTAAIIGDEEKSDMYGNEVYSTTVTTSESAACSSPDSKYNDILQSKSYADESNWNKADTPTTPTSPTGSMRNKDKRSPQASKSEESIKGLYTSHEADNDDKTSTSTSNISNKSHNYAAVQVSRDSSSSHDAIPMPSPMSKVSSGKETSSGVSVIGATSTSNIISSSASNSSNNSQLTSSSACKATAPIDELGPTLKRQLSRVASFNGFDAMPLHDVSKLGSRLERRADIANTKEFREQRLRITLDAINGIIHRVVKSEMRKARESI